MRAFEQLSTHVGESLPSPTIGAVLGGMCVLNISESTLTMMSALQFALLHSNPRLKHLDTHGCDMLSNAHRTLGVNSEGSVHVHIGEVEIEAYTVSYLDWITICRICKIAEQYDVDAIAEGFMFSFETVESLENIELPDAGCASQGWEFSATNTTEGNKFNSDADTWGTQCGVQAGSLYLFWITDTRRYGIVRELSCSF